MKQDSQDSHPEHHEPQGAHSTLREHLVRETLSDLENELTADHHLTKDSDAIPPPIPPDLTHRSDHSDPE